MSADYEPFIPAPQPTGRRLIMFNPSQTARERSQVVADTLDRKVIDPRDFENMSAALAASDAEGAPVALVNVPIAVIGSWSDPVANDFAQAFERQDAVQATRPEFWAYEYAQPVWDDDGLSTWGLKATDAIVSNYTGNNIKIAILDTGFDFAHPDFQGRQVVEQSFVAGESSDDIRGHGTHCAGTAAGPRTSAGNIPGYGVAPDTILYIGKVLANNGQGREMDIIAGVDWAIEQGCEIISMSLGRAVSPQESIDPFFEATAQAALAKGSLIIAAAGNESARQYRYIAPVSWPAYCPSVVAVAAVDARGQVADFSCGATGAGSVDLAAPGVAVFSAFPGSRSYRSLDGTSMACPHVAGVAALWAESNPALRGAALSQALFNNAAKIPSNSNRAADVGRGLAKSP